MDNKLLTLVAGLLAYTVTYAQPTLPPGFSIEPVNQSAGSFKDTVDLSTPLSANITMTYMLYHGEKGKWRSVSARQIWEGLPGPDTKPVPVSKAGQLDFLDRHIYEIINYRDSLSWVIYDFGRTGMVAYRALILEDNVWKNAGEGLNSDLDATHKMVIERADRLLQEIRDREKLKKIVSDTTDFVNCLRNDASNPKDYLLDKLSKHQVVIYGELHKRKFSWDFLKTVVADDRFAEQTGTIFLELPSHTRPLFEEFLNSPDLNPEIVLKILRQEQVYGWEDRGEYEFILDVWKNNQRLPVTKRIRIIPVDCQANWDALTTHEDYLRWKNNLQEERNFHMARTIAEFLQQSTDKRNTLFIVGYNHARKYADEIPVGEGTAGKQLAERLSPEAVFSIFTHSPVIGNSGVVFGKVRNGLYDFLFEIVTGNTPLAFDLADSPFGKEPFDLFYGFSNGGSYNRHYDGYLFLKPLDNEKGAYFLPALFSDDFIAELKRRAKIFGSKDAWYDMPIEDTSKEAIIEILQKDADKKRWDFSVD